MDKKPRIVMLSQGYIYADAVLEQLSKREIILDAVVFEVAPLRPKDRWIDKIRSRLATWKSPAGELLPIQRQWWNKWTRANYAKTFLVGGGIKEDRLVDVLNQLAPDYLILCSAGLVSENIISTAKKGVLNFHPALLPWCRGVGVVERSLQRKVAVGATVYFVAPGIDTGEIVSRELLPVGQEDTLSSLREKAYDLCIRMMVEEIEKMATGEHPQSRRQNVKFPYCKLLSPTETELLKADVDRGLAVDLYHKWQTFFGSTRLPQDTHHAPDVPIKPKELVF